MSVGEYVLKIMLEEGCEIEEPKRPEVIEQINDAVLTRQFHWIGRKGKVIGFLTFKEKNGKVFINNAMIYRDCRSANNFISLRRFFRNAYKGKQFYWENKRRNYKLCYVK